MTPNHRVLSYIERRYSIDGVDDGKLPINYTIKSMVNGGEGGIRTPDSLATILVFETSAFNRSATSPF